MTNLTNDVPTRQTERFLSFSGIRNEHARLLKRYREKPNAPEVLHAITEFLRLAQPTGALLDVESERTAAQTFLDYWVTTLFRAGVELPQASLDEFDPLLQPTLPDDQCPYRKLETLPPEPSNHYFGRERLLRQCLAQLRDRNVFAVAGASGSGKGSLIKSILVPVLRAGGISGSDKWQYLIVGAKTDLLAYLYRSITRRSEAFETLQSAIKSFHERPSFLAELFKQHCPEGTLLVFDGFDEVLRSCPRQDCEALVRNLVFLWEQPTVNQNAVLVLNNDQFGDTPLVEPLRPVLSQQVLVSFDATELRQAIEEPAKLVGLKFEEGLVEKILLDVTGDPSAPTLLQFTLLRLWDRRHRNRITWEAYNVVGGGRSGLAGAAEGLYQSLSPEQGDIARNILLELVKVGAGHYVERVSVPQAELARASAVPEETGTIINKLLAERLVRFTNRGGSEPTIKLAHQALTSHWPRFVEWLDTKREVRRKRLRLASAAEQWFDKGRDVAALWRGSLLEEARTYPDLNELEESFVASSAAAETKERNRDLLRKAIAVGSTALIVLLIMASLLLKVSKEQEARQQAERIVGLGKARQSEEYKRLEAEELGREQALKVSYLERTNQFQVLKLVELTNTTYRQMQELASQETEMLKQAENAKTTAEKLRKQAEALRDDAERQRSYALAQILAREAAYARDDRARLLARQAYLLNLDSRQPTSMYVDDALRTVLSRPNNLVLEDTAPGKPVFGVAFAQNGRRVLAAGRDGSVVAWEVIKKGNSTSILPPKDSGGTAIAALSPNGELLATRQSSTNMMIRTLIRTVSPLKNLHSQRAMTNFRPVFSPDSRMLAVACSEGFVQVWNLKDGAQYAFQTAPGGSPPSAMAFSPDNQILATGARDGKVKLWSARNGNPWKPPKLLARITQPFIGFIGPPDPRTDPNVILGPTNGVTAIAFSRAGTNIAFGSGDGTVWLYEWPTRAYTPELLPGISGVVSALAYSADGRQLAAASWDGSIRLWDLTSSSRSPIALRGHQDGVTSLAFSPDAQWLASGSIDRTLRLWDLSAIAVFPTAAVPRILKDRNETAFSAAFSSDGRRLATGSWDGTVRVFREEKRADLSGPPVVLQAGFPALCIGLSGDGDKVAVGGMSGTVRLWNLRQNNTNHSELASLNEPVLSLAISKDGLTVAAGSSSGQIAFWKDPAPKASPATFPAHSMGVGALALSSDKTLLASGSWDGTAGLWLVGQNPPIRKALNNFGEIISSLAFSPDNGKIAIGTADGNIYLSSVDTQLDAAFRLEGHEGRILSLAFSPKGDFLASGSFDSTVAIWDTSQKNGPPKIRLRGRNLTSRVLAVAFNGTGDTVLSCTPSDTMLSWIGTPGELMSTTARMAEEVCNRVGRNFTTNEWGLYIGQYAGTNLGYRCTCANLCQIESNEATARK